MAKARKTTTVLRRDRSALPIDPRIAIGSASHDPWPIPAGCAYIWLAQGGDVELLRLGMPPSSGHARGHSVAMKIPTTIEAKAAAFDALVHVLRERTAAAQTARIAEPGAPDQRILDAYLKALQQGKKITKVAQGVSGAQMQKAEELLATLGLTDEDFDLEGL